MKSKKQQIIDMPTIAYYSGFNGIEIKDIEYGINDYVIAVSGAWGGTKTAHRVKIYSNINGDMYFKLYGIRIPLNECIRTNI